MQIPFTVTISPEEQDKSLLEKLRAELPGILAWAVRGCLEWQEKGLDPPETVTKATAAYREEMDILAGFLSDRCILSSDARVSARALYTAYKGWCEETGEKTLSQRKVGMALTERGLEKRRLGSSGRWWRIGVCLLNDLNEPNLISENSLTCANRRSLPKVGPEGSEGSVEDGDEAPF